VKTITERIATLEFKSEYLSTRKNCENCDFQDSWICDQKFNPIEGIEEYFKKYGAKIEVWEFGENYSKKTIRIFLNKLTLRRHREGKYWVLTFANFHCADQTENCKCFPDRCWNFEEVSSRHIFRCAELWFNLPKKYKKQNIGLVVV